VPSTTRPTHHVKPYKKSPNNVGLFLLLKYKDLSYLNDTQPTALLIKEEGKLKLRVVENRMSALYTLSHKKTTLPMFWECG
jgi:hypothetical protein